MKKYLLILLIFISYLSSFSQEKEKQEELVKKGWSFGGLPTITYDTDLGFQYGALVNLYYYGDGNRYPAYDHSLYFEVSRFTKGSGINRFYYDSDRLFKGLQTSLDISYLSDQTYDFFGFNGYDSLVNYDWTDQEQPDDIYKSRVFYKYNREMFRFKVDIQGKLANPKFRWATGINLLQFKIGSVDIEKLNEGKEGDDLLPEIDGLYEKYVASGIISKEEADGGFVPVLKVGIVYDTRDNRPNPMKGIWTEAVLMAAPAFLGSVSTFSKVSITHRQYFTLIPRDLSLVYRLAYQTTIGGKVPFYYQNQIISSVMSGASSEGLGGSKTLRGIRRNRIKGDGIFFGNVEARWKFLRFNWLKNNFYLGLNAFTDFGQVTQKISIPETHDMSLYFNHDSEKLHVTYGAGLRIAMNQNFIIAIDYGRVTNNADGDSGMNIGLNYLF